MADPAVITNDDLTEFAQLLAIAGIDAHFIGDLARNGGNTVIGLMGLGECRLSKEPPDPDTLHAFLEALREDSTLPEDQQMPPRFGTVEEQMQYHTYHQKFTHLCRLAQLRLPM